MATSILFATGSVDFERSIIETLDSYTEKGQYLSAFSATHMDGLDKICLRLRPQIAVLRSTMLKDDSSFLNLIRNLRMSVTGLRMIVSVPKLPPGSPLITGLVTYGVYDIISSDVLSPSDVAALILHPRTIQDLDAYVPKIDLNRDGSRINFEAADDASANMTGGVLEALPEEDDAEFRSRQVTHVGKLDEIQEEDDKTLYHEVSKAEPTLFKVGEQVGYKPWFVSDSSVNKQSVQPQSDPSLSSPQNVPDEVSAEESPEGVFPNLIEEEPQEQLQDEPVMIPEPVSAEEPHEQNAEAPIDPVVSPPQPIEKSGPGNIGESHLNENEHILEQQPETVIQPEEEHEEEIMGENLDHQNNVVENDDEEIVGEIPEETRQEIPMGDARSRLTQRIHSDQQAVNQRINHGENVKKVSQNKPMSNQRPEAPKPPRPSRAEDIEVPRPKVRIRVKPSEPDSNNASAAAVHDSQQQKPASKPEEKPSQPTQDKPKDIPQISEKKEEPQPILSPRQPERESWENPEPLVNERMTMEKTQESTQSKAITMQSTENAKTVRDENFVGIPDEVLGLMDVQELQQVNQALHSTISKKSGELMLHMLDDDNSQAQNTFNTLVNCYKHINALIKEKQGG